MTRFASCSLGERRFAALVEGDTLLPLDGIAELGRETPAEVLADPPLSDERVPLADVTLLPVVPHPGKVICVGLNYRAHVEEGVFIPLAPGDVVLTGTPSGVGYRRDSKVLLRYGDRMVVEIERVGRLETRVAAEVT